MGTDCNLLLIVILSFTTFFLIPALGGFLVAYMMKRQNDREINAHEDEKS